MKTFLVYLKNQVFNFNKFLNFNKYLKNQVFNFNNQYSELRRFRKHIYFLPLQFSCCKWLNEPLAPGTLFVVRTAV